MSQQIDERFYQSSVRIANYIMYLEKMDFSPPGAYVVVECCAHSPFLLPLGWRFFFPLRIAWSCAGCRTYQDKSSARFELLASWITDQYAFWGSLGVWLVWCKPFIGAAVTAPRLQSHNSRRQRFLANLLSHDINCFICMLCSSCDLPSLPFD